MSKVNVYLADGFEEVEKAEGLRTSVVRAQKFALARVVSLFRQGGEIRIQGAGAVEMELLVPSVVPRVGDKGASIRQLEVAQIDNQPVSLRHEIIRSVAGWLETPKLVGSPFFVCA